MGDIVDGRGGRVVLLFLTVVKVDLHGHEGAVFFQHGTDLGGGEIFLLRIGYVHDHRRSVLGKVGRGGLVFATLVADPMHGRRIGIRLGDDLNRVADHEGGVEAKPKVTDDAVL